MLFFGNFKESSEEGWLHVQLQNPILSLISQLHFSIGDENKPSGLRGEDGCLGLSVLWGCKVSCGRTARDGGEGALLRDGGEGARVDIVLGAEEARCLSDSSAILCSEPK